MNLLKTDGDCIDQSEKTTAKVYFKVSDDAMKNFLDELVNLDNDFTLVETEESLFDVDDHSYPYISKHNIWLKKKTTVREELKDPTGERKSKFLLKNPIGTPRPTDLKNITCLILRDRIFTKKGEAVDAAHVLVENHSLLCEKNPISVSKTGGRTTCELVPVLELTTEKFIFRAKSGYFRIEYGRTKLLHTSNDETIDVFSCCMDLEKYQEGEAFLKKFEKSISMGSSKVLVILCNKMFPKKDSEPEEKGRKVVLGWKRDFFEQMKMTYVFMPHGFWTPEEVKEENKKFREEYFREREMRGKQSLCMDCKP